jgi:hypothetical protein
MFKKNKQSRSGIIALYPAIIISSVLIILCVDASQSFLSFLYRATLFDQKTQGGIIARSCVLRVLAKHAQDNHYKGGETILINGQSCVVENFSSTTSRVSVRIGETISTEDVNY